MPTDSFSFSLSFSFSFSLPFSLEPELVLPEFVLELIALLFPPELFVFAAVEFAFPAPELTLFVPEEFVEPAELFVPAPFELPEPELAGEFSTMTVSAGVADPAVTLIVTS